MNAILENMENIITTEKAKEYIGQYLDSRPKHVLNHLHKVHTAGYFVKSFAQRNINPYRYGFTDMTIPHLPETILDISYSRSKTEFETLEPRVRLYILTMVKAMLSKLETVSINDESKLKHTSLELFDILYSTLFNPKISELLKMDISGIPESVFLKEILISIVDSYLRSEDQQRLLERFEAEIVLERVSPVGYLVHSEELYEHLKKTYFGQNSELYLPDLVIPNLKRLRATVETL
jgi:hypothetical protein